MHIFVADRLSKCIKLNYKCYKGTFGNPLYVLYLEHLDHNQKETVGGVEQQ